MKSLKYFLPASFCLLLTSCSTAYRVPEISDYESNNTNIWVAHHRFKRVEMINPQRYTPPGEVDSLYHTARHYTNGLQATNAEIARNSLQCTMITLSDKAVSKHLSEVTGTQIDVNMLLGGGALAATGVGAVAAPALAQAASASGAGILGFKSLFNEEVYRNALVQALIGAIISDRDKIKADLDAKRLQPIHLYSVDDAIEGISKLQEHGSFYYGLTIVKSDVEKATTARKDDAAPSNSLPKNATSLMTRKRMFNNLHDAGSTDHIAPATTNDTPR
jgi:hypothetical protein